MEKRDFQKVADKIIKVIESNDLFNISTTRRIIEQINEIKNSHRRTSPELQYLSWDVLRHILNYYFQPIDSEWKEELMDIFNNYG